MPTLTLPQPAGWATNGRRLLWVILGALALALIVLYFAAGAVFRGSYFTALVLIALASSVVLVVVAVQLVHGNRTSARAEHDSNGTAFFPDRRSSVLMTISLVLASISMLTIAIGLPSGLLDMPMPRSRQVISPFLAGFGALAGIVGLITWWRRGGIGYVELTTEGIDVASIVSTESVDWRDIADVRDSAEAKKTRKAVVLVLSDGEEKIIDGADIYLPGGAGLYWMVRHYWQHPGDRSELTDGRALNRLEGGHFETS